METIHDFVRKTRPSYTMDIFPGDGMLLPLPVARVTSRDELSRRCSELCDALKALVIDARTNGKHIADIKARPVIDKFKVFIEYASDCIPLSMWTRLRARIKYDVTFRHITEARSVELFCVDVESFFYYTGKFRPVSVGDLRICAPGSFLGAVFAFLCGFHRRSQSSIQILTFEMKNMVLRYLFES